MNSKLKTLSVAAIITGLAVSSLCAAQNTQTDVEKIKNLELIKGSNMNVLKVQKYQDFYFLEATVSDRGKTLTVNPIVTNDLKMVIMGNVFDASSGKRILPPMSKQTLEKIKKQKEALKKKKEAQDKFKRDFVLDKKYYDKEHLLLGDMDAKNKIVVISDPLCVACIQRFPHVFNGLKNRKDVALFYYHYPLRMHPTAGTVAKAIKLAESQGKKDVVEKIMLSDFGKKYDVYKSTDQQNALNEFNLVMGTSYKLSDLKDVSLDDGVNIAKDVKLTGTPTIIFNSSLLDANDKLYKLINKK